MLQRPDAATVIGTDGRPRCRWAAVTPEFPVRAELAHHSGQAREFSCCLRRVRLSGVANFDDNDIERLLADEGIVRYRGKIEAVINNARRTIEVVQEEGSFAEFIWLYEPAKDDALPQMRSKSPASETLSKDLRKLGFKFVGPTTVYAFMQAMGFINDHAEVCWMRKDVGTARNTLRTPT